MKVNYLISYKIYKIRNVRLDGCEYSPPLGKWRIYSPILKLELKEYCYNLWAYNCCISFLHHHCDSANNLAILLPSLNSVSVLISVVQSHASTELVTFKVADREYGKKRIKDTEQ
jgi:hypothetical protein